MTFLVVWDRMVLGSPGDVLINSVRTFESLDGSFGEDADGVANGVFTVNGAFTMTAAGIVDLSNGHALCDT